MQHPPSFDDGRPPFDADFARGLIGKCVLVGVTIEDKRGSTKRQEQFFGFVSSAEAGVGVELQLQGSRKGEVKWLPPATHVFNTASPGTYRLRSTGEEVVDPDFTATWIVVQPDA
jgi:hypothetical protein